MQSFGLALQAKHECRQRSASREAEIARQANGYEGIFATLTRSYSTRRGSSVLGRRRSGLKLGFRLPTEFTKEFGPDPLLFIHTVRPKTVLDNLLGGFDAKTNEVVELPIWNSLHIQIDWCSLKLQFRASDDVDLTLPNCEGF